MTQHPEPVAGMCQEVNPAPSWVTWVLPDPKKQGQDLLPSLGGKQGGIEAHRLPVGAGGSEELESGYLLAPLWAGRGFHRAAINPVLCPVWKGKERSLVKPQRSLGSNRAQQLHKLSTRQAVCVEQAQGTQGMVHSPIMLPSSPELNTRLFPLGWEIPELREIPAAGMGETPRGIPINLEMVAGREPHGQLQEPFPGDGAPALVFCVPAQPFSGLFPTPQPPLSAPLPSCPPCRKQRQEPRAPRAPQEFLENASTSWPSGEMTAWEMPGCTPTSPAGTCSAKALPPRCSFHQFPPG